MGGMNRAATIFAATAIAMSTARANDSQAELALGGLTFTRSDSIAIDREDLFISRDRVRVKYRFTNTSDSPIDTLVAFPLPDIPAYTDETYDRLNFWGNPRSELKFKTTIDGMPLALTLVEQAIFQDQDVSSRLTRLQIPLNRFADGFWAAINRLPKIDRDRLAADGLMIDRMDGDWQGLWTLKTTVTRHQTFPAHKTVTVEHDYVPVTGGSASGWLHPEYRTNPDFAAGLKETRRKYCIDDDWLLSFDKKFKSNKNKGGNNDYGETWIGYVLKTGANWKGPIGDFHLVVDKGKPDSMVSFCSDGVKKISSTQFEVHRTNFVPTSDLDILIVDWFNTQSSR
jgi:hypothetical protein